MIEKCKRVLSSLLFLILLLLTGVCSGPQMLTSPDDESSEQAVARQTMANYFRALHDGAYALAVDLYGGSYEVMIDHNPGLDPADLPALFEAACTVNGAVCLETASIQPLAVKESVTGEYAFKITFQNQDGSLFVLGPCCGAPEGETHSEFTFHVRKTSENHFQVMDLPVYQP